MKGQIERTSSTDASSTKPADLFAHDSQTTGPVNGSNPSALLASKPQIAQGSFKERPYGLVGARNFFASAITSSVPVWSPTQLAVFSVRAHKSPVPLFASSMKPLFAPRAT